MVTRVAVLTVAALALVFSAAAPSRASDTPRAITSSPYRMPRLTANDIDYTLLVARPHSSYACHHEGRTRAQCLLNRRGHISRIELVTIFDLDAYTLREVQRGASVLEAVGMDAPPWFADGWKYVGVRDIRRPQR